MSRSQTGLAEFWSSIRELEKFWAWIVAAAALPFFASLIEITPPWPPAIAILTAIVNLIAVILAYQLFRTSSRRVINRLMVALTAILLFLSVIYLILLSEMTFRAGTAADAIVMVKGFVCTSYGNIFEECPWLGDKELKLAEWTPEVLWTSWSITITRIALVVSWLGCFLSLSVILSSFIVHQRFVRGERAPR